MSKLESIQKESGKLSEAAPDVDLTKPSLPALAYLLEHPELWPDGFEWDYGSIRCCAIGLSWEFWRSCRQPQSWPTLGIARHYKDIFIDVSRDHLWVSPQSVADAIRRRLSEEASA